MMTEINKQDYINEVKGMFNHICLVHDTDLVRVIGFSEDICDYYYIVSDLRGNVTHSTFVGPCVSLKYIYPRYKHLENLFTLNGCPPEKEFRHDIASDEHNWRLYKIKTVNGIEDVSWMEKFKQLTDELDWSIHD